MLHYAAMHVNSEGGREGEGGEREGREGEGGGKEKGRGRDGELEGHKVRERGGGWVEHAHSRQLASAILQDVAHYEHTVRYSCSVHTTEKMYRWLGT